MLYHDLRVQVSWAVSYIIIWLICSSIFGNNQLHLCVSNLTDGYKSQLINFAKGKLIRELAGDHIRYPHLLRNLETIWIFIRSMTRLFILLFERVFSGFTSTILLLLRLIWYLNSIYCWRADTILSALNFLIFILPAELCTIVAIVF